MGFRPLLRKYVPLKDKIRHLQQFFPILGDIPAFPPPDATLKCLVLDNKPNPDEF